MRGSFYIPYQQGSPRITAYNFELWSPAWLIITVIIIRQSTQVSAICADNVNFAAMIIAVFIKIGGEGHPLAIG